MEGIMKKEHREYKHKDDKIEDRVVHSTRQRGIDRVMQKGNKASPGHSGSMAGGMSGSREWDKGSTSQFPSQG